MNKSNYQTAFLLLIVLFFMWGFITSLNDILIPHLKGVFELSYTKAMLVQLCFFGAYLIMSIPSGILLEKIGYKKGIVTGLTVMGAGCLLFLPAAEMQTYSIFLIALFILASGITILQVAANPYVAALGSPETAASRLNLAQGVNSAAHTMAPIVGTYLILAAEGRNTPLEKAQAVEIPYVGLALVLLGIAFIFSRLSLPNIKVEEEIVKSTKTLADYPYLWMGALAIFLYVGAEVSIGGFIVNYLGETQQMPEESAGHYVAFYWGGAMIGRFIGSGILTQIKANKLLAINAIGAILLVLVTIYGTGKFTMYALLSIGFFNSVMFANIFTLSIHNLGPLTKKASGILVTAIFGGAVIPPLQGKLADGFDIKTSFVIAVFCYAYVLFFALKGYQWGREE